MIRKATLFYLFLILLIFAGCIAGNSENQENGKISVMVTIPPQKYFLEKVGGDRLNVSTLVPPGSSPHSYEPKPDEMKELSKVKAYFTAGVEMEEAWMDKIVSVNKEMKIIDTTKGIEYMITHHECNNGEHDHHDHSRRDRHIWLSPGLVKIQAENMCKGLIEIDPHGSDYYKENLKNFLLEIDELDKDIKEKLSGLENRKFMIFHPSWGYFARDYDLEMIPIEVEGKEPSASEITALIDKAKENNIKVVFASPSFSTRTATVIAGEIHGKVLSINDLEENWEENLRTVARTFESVMEKKK